MVQLVPLGIVLSVVAELSPNHQQFLAPEHGMKRIMALGLVGLLLTSVTGCGGPDSLMKEFIANLNAYAETLEKKEPKEKQQAALDRVKATSDKLNNLKLSEADKEKLVKKHEGDLKTAMERLFKAWFAQAAEGGGLGGDAPDIFGGFKPK